MSIEQVIAVAGNLLLQYPFEKHIKPNRDKLDSMYEDMKTKMLSLQTVQAMQSFPKRDAALSSIGDCKTLYQHDDGDVTVSCQGKNYVVTTEGAVFEEREIESPQRTLAETIQREQTGDYCFSCVPSKHLMRVKDALTDASNIANDKGFNDVAESKIQEAVLELNGAEKDLEKAAIPEEIKPAASELKNQIRKLRNFLRQDQSGLEIATAFPKEQHEDMKKSLEVANTVTDLLIKYGYDVSKLQMKARAEAKSNANS